MSTRKKTADYFNEPVYAIIFRNNTEKIKKELEDRCQGRWFVAGSSSTFNEYAPRSKNVKSEFGEKFPAAKITHSSGMIVLFTHKGDYEKFKLMNAGE